MNEILIAETKAVRVARKKNMKKYCKYSKGNICEETQELCTGKEDMRDFCGDYEEEEND